LKLEEEARAKAAEKAAEPIVEPAPIEVSPAESVAEAAGSE
jgi:hypothetical protein